MGITDLRNRYGDHFTAFWRVYPKKTRIADAERAFFSACLAGYDPVMIVAKATSYARSVDPDELKFVPAPGNWLGGRQFEDNDLFTDQRNAEKEWLHGCWERVDVRAVENRFQVKMPRVNAPEGMEAEDIPIWYKSQCREFIRSCRQYIQENDV